MTRFLILSLVAFVGACTVNDDCNPGFVDINGECTPVDGGTSEDGSVDASDAEVEPDMPDMTIGDAGPDMPDVFDAGPCGMECTGETPHCDPATMACVECVVPADCTGAADMCESGLCVECANNTHCTTAEASLCSTGNACAPCAVGTDCDGIMDGATALNVCDTSGAAGLCVACTLATEETDCGANSCDPATSRCTDTPRGLTVPCGECAADSECFPGHACVALDYDGAAHGNYCLPIAMGSCDGRPYTVGIVGRTSISGVEGQNYCGISEALTTCEAVLGLPAGSGNECTPGPDSATGVYVQDTCPVGAFCVPHIGVVGVGSNNRCTYECSAARQCTDPGELDGSTCNVRPSGPQFCGG